MHRVEISCLIVAFDVPTFPRKRLNQCFDREKIFTLYYFFIIDVFIIFI